MNKLEDPRKMNEQTTSLFINVFLFFLFIFHNIFIKIARVLNFFITYGMKILPTVDEYDALHYSILRNGPIILECCDNCIFSRLNSFKNTLKNS